MGWTENKEGGWTEQRGGNKREEGPMTHSAVGEGHSVASRQNCVRGAQVWLRKKTENNKCISYHPEHHSILRSMRYCIRPV